MLPRDHFATRSFYILLRKDPDSCILLHCFDNYYLVANSFLDIYLFEMHETFTKASRLNV
jgi:hypothetical protein